MANETNKIDTAFEALEKRVKEFQETPFSHEDDINDFEDSYIQLVLEITEMADSEESKIFDNQTIFYLSSADKSELGMLFHLTNVTLTNEHPSPTWNH